MKIGEWDNLGRARGLLQRQLGELGASEDAAHVAVNPDTGRLRIYMATDLGLFDYTYSSTGGNLEGDWILRGQLHQWTSVRGLRLQTDAQIDATTSVWRHVAEDPKMELSATSDAGPRAIDGCSPWPEPVSFAPAEAQ